MVANTAFSFYCGKTLNWFATIGRSYDSIEQLSHRHRER